ncbi:HRDC domain-containing protein [uncultured Tessaracoccus sp.]|uniref:HRDC domain-containing protein n=1 Tax=uncultured Tessaracoccus sp. TaxID=905023 RepID=UPI00261E9741|nr:HRDC domain-containing protein [uncultured Tessaracoccus sp.]
MTLVDEPREPLRPVVADDEALSRCLDSLARASGPVGFDVERAHGYRYWPCAYLLQIRRGEAGTWLIDPTCFDNTQLAELVECADNEEWIIHAASQDLPSMFDCGVVPERLFDTELAARLLGKPSVALGAILAAELGIELRKAHSSVNWAMRPLKQSWLTYAALDVDFLAELRGTLDAQLREAHRREWAEQEFQWELGAFAKAPEARVDPWRKTSHITAVRYPRGLALVRELWHERDEIAQHRDRPPTHILPDAALVDAGVAAGKDRVVTPDTLRRFEGFTKHPGRRYFTRWANAVERFNALSANEYPPKRFHMPGSIPHPKTWERVDGEAAERWRVARPAIDDFACEIGIQASLLAPPAALRRAIWEGVPSQSDLLEAGMRPWQADLLAGLIDELLG